MKENFEKLKEGIEKFLEENTPNVFAVNDEIFTSTELGELENLPEKGTAKGRKMNELLAEMGFLEENKERNKGIPKWKLTNKGRKYAITPIKFIVSIVNDDNNILIDLKKDTHRWIGAIRKEIEKYIKEKKENGQKQQ